MSINFEPDVYDTNWANYEIQTKGHVRALDDLLHSLDCSRYIEGVGYPINVNHYSYARYSWEYNYIIEHGIDNGILSDEQCQIYRERFNALDKQNEAFAMAHPEIGNYKKSKGIKSKKDKADVVECKPRSRIVATKDMFSGKVSTETLSEDGSLKKTVADRRLDALNARAVKFSFGTFKPKNE